MPVRIAMVMMKSFLVFGMALLPVFCYCSTHVIIYIEAREVNRINGPRVGKLKSISFVKQRKHGQVMMIIR